MKWDYNGFNYDADKEYKCSNCGNIVIDIQYPFCPWCGEKRETEKETNKKLIN